MKRRLLLAGSAALGTGLLAGCSAPKIADYANEKPQLDLRRYFNGTIDAYGVFTDRSGKVVKRFTVVMQCTLHSCTASAHLWRRGGPKGASSGSP